MNYENKVCSRCGGIVTETQQFCTKCGAHINHPYINTVQNQIPNTKTTKQLNTNKNLTSYFIIILLIILIAIAVFVAFSINAAKNKSYEANNTAEIPQDEYRYYESSQQQYDYEDNAAVNNIDYYSSDDDYIFPSDRQIITTNMLNNLTKEQIALIRNEIYARHGYIFKSEEYRKYFMSKDWYVPNEYFSESLFNETEKINKSTIVEYEKSMGWR